MKDPTGKTSGHATIDEYIRAAPKPVQGRLTALRKLVHAVAPEAEERITYRIPTFYLNGNLVHFGYHSNHIGFYPTPSAIVKFKRELSKYASSKGAVQFPHDQPLPMELIRKIVTFRVGEKAKKKP